MYLFWLHVSCFVPGFIAALVILHTLLSTDNNVSEVQLKIIGHGVGMEYGTHKVEWSNS